MDTDGPDLKEKALTAKKLFAAGLCCAFLGFQMYVIVPPGGRSRDWYWPFVDYPMYSYARQPGRTFTNHQVRAFSCGPVSVAVVLSNKDLFVTKFVFYRLLEAATGFRLSKPIPQEASDRAAGRLAHLIRTKLADSYCGVEIWGRTFTIALQGLESADVPWTLRRAGLEEQLVQPH